MVDESTFKSVLSWLLNHRAVYGSGKFNIYAITFNEEELLGFKFSPANAIKKLDALGASLAAYLREADLVTRHGAFLYVLTPPTSADQLAFRINAIVKELVHSNNLNIIEWGMAGIDISASPTTDADEFIAGLNSGKYLTDAITYYHPAISNTAEV